ncbi:MAG: hypothetical protein JO001_06745 [Alphaproteobacteria bacterium]|nr:hypothetical protein [Alphaproteobacteria bacterium]
MAKKPYYDTTLLPDEDPDLTREVLETVGEAWLYAKNVWLAGRTPAELIGTRDEFQVRNLVRSIKGADLA